MGSYLNINIDSTSTSSTYNEKISASLEASWSGFGAGVSGGAKFS